jgi:hypothetical protein
MTAIAVFLFLAGIIAGIIAKRYQWATLREIVNKRPDLADSIYGKIPGLLKWKVAKGHYQSEFPKGNKAKISDYLGFTGMLAMLVAIAILLVSSRR